MYELIFLIVLALVWMSFASIQDFRFREVANWLNFSLIIFALGFRFFWSLFSEGNFNFFYQGLIGLGIFLVLGNMFYYGRFFAGGDAKLMIALGVILPISYDFYFNLKIFGLFLVLFIFIGSIYGILWGGFLILNHRKDFKKDFSKMIKSNKKILFGSGIFGLLFFLIGFVDVVFFIIGIFVFLIPFFYFSAKSIENCCMIMEIPTRNLREGDWLVKDLRVRGKLIKRSWEGLNETDIKFLKKNLKKIKIKQGIAFVPVFLISFICLVLSGMLL